MTTTDIILRINEAIQNQDQLDLNELYGQINVSKIEETENTAWLALIETVNDSIDGAFR